MAIDHARASIPSTSSSPDAANMIPADGPDRSSDIDFISLRSEKRQPAAFLIAKETSLAQRHLLLPFPIELLQPHTSSLRPGWAQGAFGTPTSSTCHLLVGYKGGTRVCCGFLESREIALCAVCASAVIPYPPAAAHKHLSLFSTPAGSSSFSTTAPLNTVSAPPISSASF